MAQDMEGLQRAEQSLQEMQKVVQFLEHTIFYFIHFKVEHCRRLDGIISLVRWAGTQYHVSW